MRTMFYARLENKETPVRVYFKDGVCKTGNQVVLDKMESVRIQYTGQRQREIKNRNLIPPQFMGEQDPPKGSVKKIEINETGSEVKAPKPKREKAIIDPALITDMKRYAEENKTITETAKALEMPYAKIATLAKKEGITFKAGIKGRQSKGPKEPNDPAIVASLKRLAGEGKTAGQASKELGIVWYKVLNIAKVEGIVFQKGQRGRKAKP